MHVVKKQEDMYDCVSIVEGLKNVAATSEGAVCSSDVDCENAFDGIVVDELNAENSLTFAYDDSMY